MVIMMTIMGENVTDPRELVRIAFKVTKEHIAATLNKSTTIQAANNDPRAAQGLEICHDVIWRNRTNPWPPLALNISGS
ncbi:hypothetical protein AKJ16_DCAP18484 [Drosera capensis]